MEIVLLQLHNIMADFQTKEHPIGEKIFNTQHTNGTRSSTGISSERPLEHGNKDMCITAPQTRVIGTLHRFSLRPNRFQHVRHPHPGDAALRHSFCQWTLNRCGEIPNIMFTDDATSSLMELTTVTNNQVCVDENLHATVEAFLN
ncbi:hypothetical protein PR048_008922 [Dryococelus australis]|uniref:Uncharacterized protein n=1 Tax=Dryococelus australis TaxID=614101 RepID=A0ABQ9HYG5_9NEOP|nr:hypothetical protein PR048_008922 [Dryococelus australis]